MNNDIYKKMPKSINDDIEPKLIDKKLILYFRDYKNNRPKSSSEMIFINFKNFIKKNYGFILLLLLLVILLYVRYVEVNKKKKYIKKLIEEKKLKKKKVVNFNEELDY
jgi:hypothetical protein